jgi:uncharacterized protein with FMN-binding domain
MIRNGSSSDKGEGKMRRAIIPLLCVFALYVGCEESESQKIRELQLPDIDLSRVEDGAYRGSFIHHDNVYETEVEIEDHRIQAIQVLQSEGDKYDRNALPVIQRVIEKQSLQVDSVTGATKSSKLYLITIYSALSGAEYQIH